MFSEFVYKQAQLNLLTGFPRTERGLVPLWQCGFLLSVVLLLQRVDGSVRVKRSCVD